VYEEGDVTVLWNQAVHKDREVTANRPDIIIKNKKRENMYTDRCGNTRRQKCCAKGSGKEVEIEEFMYRDTTNVEPEMYDYTTNNWSHWNSKRLKSLYGAFQYLDLLGLLYSYPNKFPYSSREAPRIIQMCETSTSEGGNYSPQFC
jgi:hypothetical protein